LHRHDRVATVVEEYGREVEEGPPFELWIVSARRALERVFYFGELWVAIGGSVGQVGQLLRLDLRPLP
ncbi:MAG TPA: hypothetical protein PLE78_08655, partial [Flavobacteriales bacterium]|nr:hypothetical protein [Flavobacteriales bacterium]